MKQHGPRPIAHNFWKGNSLQIGGVSFVIVSIMNP
jgi:hypothetical protein